MSVTILERSRSTGEQNSVTERCRLLRQNRPNSEMVFIKLGMKRDVLNMMVVTFWNKIQLLRVI